VAIFASKYKIEFNLSKSKLLRFNSKLAITPRPIQLHGQKLEEVTHFKYLGVTFDSDLPFDTHVKCMITKARSSAFLLQPILCRLENFCAARKIILAYILPILTYLLGSWRPKKTQLLALQRPLLTCFRQLCRLSKSTSIEELHRTLAIPSLSSICHAQVLKLAADLHELSPIDPAHQALSNELKHPSSFSNYLNKSKVFFNIPLASTPSNLTSHIKNISQPSIPLFLSIDSKQTSKLRIRLFLKQSNLRHHLHTKQLISSPSCIFCQMFLNLTHKDSLQHLLLDCPLYNSSRSTLNASLHTINLHSSNLTHAELCGVVIPASLSSLEDQCHFIKTTATFLNDLDMIRGPI
jgi:hypothetical protein